MRDDVAFQSQVFGEQVAQRRDRYAAQNIQTYQQAGQLPMQMMQAQAMQQEMTLQRQQVGSHLATQELARQEAMQKMQWARELHTTDMIAMQSEAVRLDLEMKRSQVEKMQRDLSGEMTVPDYLQTDPRHMLGAYAAGLEPRIEGNRVTFGPASDEVRDMARKTLLTRGGTGSGMTPNQIRMDMVTAERMYQDAIDSGAPEEEVEALRQYRDETRSSFAASRGMDATKPTPAAPKKPDIRQDKEFQKRVGMALDRQPTIAPTIGAGNAKKLATEVLANLEPFRRSLSKYNPDRDFSDQEVLDVVLDYTAKATRAQNTRENPELAAWRQWVASLVEQGVLDQQELKAAQEALSSSGEQASRAFGSGR